MARSIKPNSAALVVEVKLHQPPDRYPCHQLRSICCESWQIHSSAETMDLDTRMLHV
jgi:hypothetical protein